MKIEVLKFGGSSVANISLIKNIAQKIKKIKEDKKDIGIVVVVSAMGDTTDELLNLVKQITPSPNQRELDALLSTGEQVSAALLAIALNDIGQPAISLNATQAKIFTDNNHTKAMITRINSDKIRKELEEGKVVVITGFQGITEEGDITTLGRGGSDATAVVLSYALSADICQIYTDVDGVYTADPKIVPESRRIDKLSYEEMLELSSLGAKVLQAKSVELANRYNVILHVKSSFNENEEKGTIICKETKDMEEDVLVSGVVGSSDESKITIRDLPDRPGIAAALFSALAKNAINVDMIVQGSSTEQKANLSFTVSRQDLKKAFDITNEVSKQIQAKEVVYDENMAKVSIVGIGMRSHAGVAAKMFKTLAEQNINIDMISTSEIKISCVIKKDCLEEAIRALHKAFNLDKKNNNITSSSHA